MEGSNSAYLNLFDATRLFVSFNFYAHCPRESVHTLRTFTILKISFRRVAVFLLVKEGPDTRLLYVQALWISIEGSKKVLNIPATTLRPILTFAALRDTKAFLTGHAVGPQCAMTRMPPMYMNWHPSHSTSLTL